MNYFRQISLSVFILLLVLNIGHGQSKPWISLENSQQLITDKETRQITISFRIKEGIHINANEISNANLIPTTVALHWSEGISGGENRFSAAQLLTLTETEDPIEVFYDTITITAPITIHDNLVNGNYAVSGELYYQPCSDTRCFYPETLDFQLELAIQ